jgi:hypothetical protein
MATTTNPSVELARECVALKRAHADVFLTMRLKGKEEEGMLLYCCQNFVESGDASAMLLKNAEFTLRPQFQRESGIPNAIKRLLEFEIAENTTPPVELGNKAYAVRVRGCPSRVFYLVNGKVYTLINEVVKVVLNITLEGSIALPSPKITYLTLLTLESSGTSGKSTFAQHREACETIALSASMLWAA